MSSLPEEIIEENILTRLPVKSISRFRCVSKSWFHLFRNPNFIRNHLNHAIVINNLNILVTNYGTIYNIPTETYLSSTVLSPPTPYLLGQDALKIDYPFMSLSYVPQILGSSNGLVCIKIKQYDHKRSRLDRIVRQQATPYRLSVCIWNPATREYTTVPEAPTPYGTSVYGFGFDCKNDDYKILRLVHIHSLQKTEAILYSLASNSWKKLGFVPYDFSERLPCGLLCNGVLHWLATVVDPNGHKSRVTVFYNISDETFYHLPLPNNHWDENLDLGIWEGKLCLLWKNHMEDPDICTHQNDHMDMWIMMDNKWSKHLKISAHVTDMYYGRPIATLQNGEILFEGVSMGEKRFGLMSYDPMLERARALKIYSCFPFVSYAGTYIETLVPLHSGTYVGEKQIE